MQVHFWPKNVNKHKDDNVQHCITDTVFKRMVAPSGDRRASSEARSVETLWNTDDMTGQDWNALKDRPIVYDRDVSED